VISGPDKVAVIRQENRPQDALDLIERYMSDLDLVLVEGFKRYGFPRLEVVRSANSRSPVCSPEELSALVSDLSFPDLALPVFALDEVSAIVDHIEARLQA
jgi:molybdopterin-guanine dinucleotide biosynthesis protein B